MSRQERSTRVRLDRLADEQLAILREEANDWLVAKAADLSRGTDDDGRRREVGEVAALGRLVSGLRCGEVVAPDRVVRDLIARTTTETGRLDELLKEEYDRALTESEAWVALLAHFDGGGGR
jgi:hypothetical protein